jgi:hypothetical protein
MWQIIMMRFFNTSHVRFGKVDIQFGERAEFATVAARESQCPAAKGIRVFHGAHRISELAEPMIAM